MSHQFSSAHWRQQAEEARVRAERMADEELRASMLEIASNYEKMAAFAEKLESWPRKPPQISN